mmetsp:Transcript_34249/g.100591  ORF Transcript_34249/g.100591 Transcript_34249/m.100591 type:complete len:236 (+) Transcript_34249:791-1498(+)
MPRSPLSQAITSADLLTASPISEESRFTSHIAIASSITLSGSFWPCLRLRSWFGSSTTSAGFSPPTRGVAKRKSISAFAIPKVTPRSTTSSCERGTPSPRSNASRPARRGSPAAFSKLWPPLWACVPLWRSKALAAASSAGRPSASRTASNSSSTACRACHSEHAARAASTASWHSDSLQANAASLTAARARFATSSSLSPLRPPSTKARRPAIALSPPARASSAASSPARPSAD